MPQLRIYNMRKVKTPTGASALEVAIFMSAPKNRAGIQRSESGPKAKEFPVRRSFPPKTGSGAVRGILSPVRQGVVAYGKLFAKKTGLVSREWYPDLANYRCNGYDFDARYEDGLASYREKRVMDVLLQNEPTLSKDMKRLAGFGGDGSKDFDTVITNLQMQTYITVHGFEYARDRHGKPYGWGMVRYAMAEDVLGADVTQRAYDRDTEESKRRIVQHLGLLCRRLSTMIWKS